jgi:hypothetical protein
MILNSSKPALRSLLGDGKAVPRSKIPDGQSLAEVLGDKVPAPLAHILSKAAGFPIPTSSVEDNKPDIDDDDDEDVIPSGYVDFGTRRRLLPNLARTYSSTVRTKSGASRGRS